MASQEEDSSWFLPLTLPAFNLTTVSFSIAQRNVSSLKKTNETNPRKESDGLGSSLISDVKRQGGRESSNEDVTGVDEEAMRTSGGDVEVKNDGNSKAMKKFKVSGGSQRGGSTTDKSYGELGSNKGDDTKPGEASSSEGSNEQNFKNEENGVRVVSGGSRVISIYEEGQGELGGCGCDRKRVVVEASSSEGSNEQCFINEEKGVGAKVKRSLYSQGEGGSSDWDGEGRSAGGYQNISRKEVQGALKGAKVTRSLDCNTQGEGGSRGNGRNAARARAMSRNEKSSKASKKDVRPQTDLKNNYRREERGSSNGDGFTMVGEGVRSVGGSDNSLRKGLMADVTSHIDLVNEDNSQGERTTSNGDGLSKVGESLKSVGGNAFLTDDGQQRKIVRRRLKVDKKDNISENCDSQRNNKNEKRKIDEDRAFGQVKNGRGELELVACVGVEEENLGDEKKAIECGKVPNKHVQGKRLSNTGMRMQRKSLSRGAVDTKDQQKITEFFKPPPLIANSALYQREAGVSVDKENNGDEKKVNQCGEVPKKQRHDERLNHIGMSKPKNKRKVRGEDEHSKAKVMRLRNKETRAHEEEDKPKRNTMITDYRKPHPLIANSALYKREVDLWRQCRLKNEEKITKGSKTEVQDGEDSGDHLVERKQNWGVNLENRKDFEANSKNEQMKKAKFGCKIRENFESERSMKNSKRGIDEVIRPKDYGDSEDQQNTAVSFDGINQDVKAKSEKKKRKTLKEQKIPALNKPMPSKDETGNSVQLRDDFEQTVKSSEALDDCSVDNKHVCDICAKSFPYECHLRTHKQKVHGIMGEYNCQLCGKSLSSKNFLDIHIKRGCSSTRNTRDSHLQKVDTSPGITVYVCNVCNKSFHSTNSLRWHRKLHVPCECPVCHKTFTGHSNLNLHLHSVHAVERIYTCNLCSDTFKRNGDLTQHKIKVHSDDRPHVCEKCNFRFSKKYNYNAHVRTVHEKGYTFICDICHIGIKRKGDLKIHKIKKHSMDISNNWSKVFNTHECRLHEIPVQLPNKASYLFHRMNHHKEMLGENEPKCFQEIHTSNDNLVYFLDNSEMVAFLDDQNDSMTKCLGCRYEFFDRTAHLSHLEKYHSMTSIEHLHLSRELSECLKTIPVKEENYEELLKEMYRISTRMSQFCDSMRKIYKLLIVPDYLMPHEIQDYIRNPKNIFYLYIGKLSVGKENIYISQHHISESGLVCTNLFAALNKKHDMKFKFVHISDEWVQKEDGLTGLESLSKTEIIEIFTLFLFAKKYHRKDIFFQKIEIAQLRKYITGSILSDIVRDVEESEGNIMRLRNIRIDFYKELDIFTDNITPDQLEFSKCKRCPGKTPMISKCQATSHAIKCLKKKNLNRQERLLSMVDINEEEILEIISPITKHDFCCYGIVGTDNIVNPKNMISYLRGKQNTDSYIGQNSSGNISSYHFQCGIPSSLKTMKGNNRYVYSVRKWRFSCAEDMYHFESAAIIIGAIRRENTSRKDYLSLINKNIQLYDISAKFSYEEFRMIYEYAVGNECIMLDDRIPSFLNVCDRNDCIKNITDRIKMGIEENGDAAMED